MPNGHVLAFPGTRVGFERAFADLRDALDRHDVQHRTRYRCELVFEEIVTNIINHAYKDNEHHERCIRVSLDFRGDSIVIGFEDDGTPFDPREQQPGAALGKSLLETSIGGRGLLLVRGAAERLDYRRTLEERNHLTVTIMASDGGSRR